MEVQLKNCKKHFESYYSRQHKKCVIVLRLLTYLYVILTQPQLHPIMRVAHDKPSSADDLILLHCSYGFLGLIVFLPTCTFWHCCVIIALPLGNILIWFDLIWFVWKKQYARFWPVCSKYAAVCSSSGLDGYIKKWYSIYFISV